MYSNWLYSFIHKNYLSSFYALRRMGLCFYLSLGFLRILQNSSTYKPSMFVILSIIKDFNEMVGWHHGLNENEFEQTPGDSEGQGSLECCSS